MVLGISTLLLLLAFAAWHDLSTHRIPNILTGMGVVLGMGYQVLGSGSAGALSAVEGMGMGLMMFLPFYLMRAMGAGDVKLMAMVGVWLGPGGTIGAVLGSFIAGGVMAVVFAMKSGVLKNLIRNVALLLPGMFSRQGRADGTVAFGLHRSLGKLPYGVAIALGTTGFLIWHGGF